MQSRHNRNPDCQSAVSQTACLRPSALFDRSQNVRHSFRLGFGPDGAFAIQAEGGRARSAEHCSTSSHSGGAMPCPPRDVVRRSICLRPPSGAMLRAPGTHALRSRIPARISATTSGLGFAPCGPPWWRRTLTAPDSMARPSIPNRSDGPSSVALLRRVDVRRQARSPLVPHWRSSL